MDKFASVAQQSVIAALKGQGWIDRTFDPSTWEHRYYTATRMLFDRHEEAWRCYLQTSGWMAGSPSHYRQKTMQSLFRDCLDEVGIELFPVSSAVDRP